jgi:hypothetical protein
VFALLIILLDAGTYKLAGDVWEHLNHFQQAELDLNSFDRQALMLAGEAVFQFLPVH